jgi:hypothetical protein
MEREYARKMVQFVSILKRNYTLNTSPNPRIDSIINVFDLSLHETAIVHKIISKKASSTYVHLYSKNGITYGTSYTISNSQFRFIIIKILIELLAANNCFLLHASSVLIHGQIYLFTGDSGAGKSTIVKLLTPQFIPFTDELVLVRRKGKLYCAGQSFFREKNRMIKPYSKFYPIEAVFFIHQSEKSFVRHINNKQTVMQKIVKQLRTDRNNEELQFKQVVQFVRQRPIFSDLFFEKNKREINKLLIGHNKHPVENSNHGQLANNYMQEN